MTLNKVPNVDDLKRLRIAYQHQWTWCGTSATQIKDRHPVTFSQTTNGTKNHTVKRTELSHDGTSDEHSAASFSPQDMKFPERGKVVTLISAAMNSNPGAATNPQQVGVRRTPSSGEDSSKQATVRLKSENAVVVDENGNKTSKDISTNFTSHTGGNSTYQIGTVIDIDNTETHFYVNKGPFSHDPDATIQVIPGGTESSGIQEPHVAMFGGSSSAEEIHAIGGKQIMLY